MVKKPSDWYPKNFATEKGVTVQTVRRWMRQGKLEMRGRERPATEGGGWAVVILGGSVKKFDRLYRPVRSAKMTAYRLRKKKGGR